MRKTLRAASRQPGTQPRRPDCDRDAGTLHLVGVISEEGFAFLERATLALVGMNVPQTVVLLEGAHYARLGRQFHPSVELISVPFSGLTKPWAWVRAMCIFRTLTAKRSFSAIHLHGLLPSLLGGFFISDWNLPARVLCSPHSARSLVPARALGISAMAILSERCALARQVPVASSSSEARNLYTVIARPVEVVENEIGAPHFDVLRNEARRPLVVAAGWRDDYKNADIFAQAAVLLGDAHLRVQFNWCGHLDPRSQAQLCAANVALFDVRSDSELAIRLAPAWVFVQSSERPGFPLHVACAMAAGVPCVVSNTAYHRDVIKHTCTGYIYRTEAELVRHIAQLLDDKDLRWRIGQAARAEAQRRFGPARFRSSLRRLYGMNQAGPLPERIHEQRDPEFAANNEQAELLRNSHAG